MSDYHGPKPVTKADVKLAKKHLKATQKLVKSKVKEHQKAAKTTNTKSKSYNKGHVKGHQTELKQISKSLKTISKLRPV